MRVSRVVVGNSDVVGGGGGARVVEGTGLEMVVLITIDVLKGLHAQPKAVLVVLLRRVVKA